MKLGEYRSRRAYLRMMIDQRERELAEHRAELKRISCRECGGEGEVPLSREPCSTDTFPCPKCDGTGMRTEDSQ